MTVDNVSPALVGPPPVASAALAPLLDLAGRVSLAADWAAGAEMHLAPGGGHPEVMVYTSRNTPTTAQVATVFATLGQEVVEIEDLTADHSMVSGSVPVAGVQVLLRISCKPSDGAA